MQDPVVDKIVAHVERVVEHGVPDTARAVAKAFIADTLAVGIAGSQTQWRGEILDMLAGVGGAEEATVFGGGEKLPLVHAAMLNAYQIHTLVFDFVLPPEQETDLWDAVFAVETLDDIRPLAGLGAPGGTS